MNWIDKQSAQDSLDLLGHLAFICYTTANCRHSPLTSRIYDLVVAKDYLGLVNYEIDYSENPSLTDVRYARQILAFYQKLPFLNLGYDRDSVAAARFVRSEKLCLDVNRTLDYHARKPSMTDPAIASIMFIAQCKIARILGPVPPLDALPFSFGPGSNTNVRSDRAFPRGKLGVSLECSASMASNVGEFLSETPLWAASKSTHESEDSWFVDVTVVPGKVMFVPKNAKTNRSIVVEPLLNSFFQKGVGSYIRGRLLRSGVDLKDQSRNQSLAFRGSSDGSLATVDLSMASDCIAYGLCLSLLPFGWVDLLDRLRTPVVKLPSSVTQSIIDEESMTAYMTPGAPYTLEKFSSMGNGFTFELESLLFFGLAVSCVEFLGLSTVDVSVYGDDIIIPTDAYDLLEKVLNYCGFSVNTDKSYRSGPFRESCGSDFYNGFDIRPYYQKDLISERSLYSMHNWFVRHGEFELANAVRSALQPDLLLFGPDGMGDGHLLGDFTLRRNRKLDRAGWSGGYFDTYALRPRRFKAALPGDALLPTYSVYTRSGELDPTDPDVIRGSSGYAKVSIYTLLPNIFNKR